MIFYPTLLPSEQARKVGVDAQSKCEHLQLSTRRAGDLIIVQISYWATELYWVEKNSWYEWKILHMTLFSFKIFNFGLTDFDNSIICQGQRKGFKIGCAKFKLRTIFCGLENFILFSYGQILGVQIWKFAQKVPLPLIGVELRQNR